MVISVVFSLNLNADTAPVAANKRTTELQNFIFIVAIDDVVTVPFALEKVYSVPKKF